LTNLVSIVGACAGVADVAGVAGLPGAGRGHAALAGVGAAGAQGAGARLLGEGFIIGLHQPRPHPTQAECFCSFNTGVGGVSLNRPVLLLALRLESCAQLLFS